MVKNKTSAWDIEVCDKKFDTFWTLMIIECILAGFTLGYLWRFI